jgi:hypothetical protein
MLGKSHALVSLSRNDARLSGVSERVSRVSATEHHHKFTVNGFSVRAAPSLQSRSFFAKLRGTTCRVHGNFTTSVHLLQHGVCRQLREEFHKHLKSKNKTSK